MVEASRSLRSIQALRALAAWGVVFHHFVQILFGLGPELQIYAKSPAAAWFNAFWLNYGLAGVDIFFVISGLVMYISTNGTATGPRSFVLNRLTRIVPAYWFFTACVAVFALTSNIMETAKLDPAFLLKSLFFIPAANPSGIGLYPLLTVGWTLNYEMAFYVIFAISLLFSPVFRILAVAAGIFLLQTAVPHVGHGFSFYADRISYEFLLGIFVGAIYCKGWLRLPPAIAVVAIAAALGAIYFAPDYTHDAFRWGVPCALIVAAALSLENTVVWPNWLLRLGDWSYSTYLCHPIVLFLGYRAALTWHLNPWFLLPVCFAAIAVVSYLGFARIEKPANAFLRKRIGTPRSITLEAKSLPQ